VKGQALYKNIILYGNKEKLKKVKKKWKDDFIQPMLKTLVLFI
jgi:hypothetical protein